MEGNYRKIGLGLMAVAGVFFLVGIVGMTVEWSNRWTEPFQQLGWIFFIIGYLLLYLHSGREIIRPQMAKVAWLAGCVSVVFFLLALIFNAASSDVKTWYEAFETVGSIAMLVMVMSAIWSVGGMKQEPSSPADGL